jgi:hypothetical protein
MKPNDYYKELKETKGEKEILNREKFLNLEE